MSTFNEKGEIIHEHDTQRVSLPSSPPSGIRARRQSEKILSIILLGLGSIALLIFAGAIIKSNTLGEGASSLQENTIQMLLPTKIKTATIMTDSTPRSIIPTTTIFPKRLAQISNEVEEVNLRQSPGYITKNDSDVIIKIPQYSEVEIIDGPEYADNLVWWYVSWNNYTGWMADHTGTGRTILIFIP